MGVKLFLFSYTSRLEIFLFFFVSSVSRLVVGGGGDEVKKKKKIVVSRLVVGCDEVKKKKIVLFCRFAALIVIFAVIENLLKNKELSHL